MLFSCSATFSYYCNFVSSKMFQHVSDRQPTFKNMSLPVSLEKVITLWFSCQELFDLNLYGNAYEMT